MYSAQTNFTPPADRSARPSRLPFVVIAISSAATAVALLAHIVS